MVGHSGHFTRGCPLGHSGHFTRGCLSTVGHSGHFTRGCPLGHSGHFTRGCPLLWITWLCLASRRDMRCPRADHYLEKRVLSSDAKAGRLNASHDVSSARDATSPPFLRLDAPASEGQQQRAHAPHTPSMPPRILKEFDSTALELGPHVADGGLLTRCLRVSSRVTPRLIKIGLSGRLEHHEVESSRRVRRRR